MRKELQVLHEISTIKGKGSTETQINLLSENLTDDMKFLLNVAFNPFVTTKLNKLNVIITGNRIEPNIEQFKNLINTLIEGKSANNELREIMGRYVGSVDLEENERQILLDIITKNLVIGIKEKTINKAAGYEFIPTPSLMLAKEKEGVIDKWNKIYCEVKYDGVRIVAIVKDGDIKFFSRNFNEVDSTRMSRIKADLISLLGGDLNREVFFDGELTDFDRKTVSGKFNKILKGTAPKDIDKSFIFHVFDFEDASVLSSGKGTTYFTERRRRLEEMFHNKHTSDHTQLGISLTVNSAEEVADIYSQVVEGGGEGVICKCDHLYETKRSENWIKFKQIQDCDLKVVGWEEGTGKRTGFIGSLICESECGKLKVNVGSGFKDSELEDVNERIRTNELIGKIAVIRYNERITDKYGSHSLFLPRFIEIREDKDVADIIESIK
jgi:ATP-dependent DNA ligase